MNTNYCFIVGNLGSDPVERGKQAKNQEPHALVMGFSVAENIQAFDEDLGTYKTVHTNWFNVTTFGTMAERVKSNLKKGDRVAVQGRMKISKYQTKAGEERVGFEIIADQVALWKNLPSGSGIA